MALDEEGIGNLKFDMTENQKFNDKLPNRKYPKISNFRASQKKRK